MLLDILSSKSCINFSTTKHVWCSTIVTCLLRLIKNVAVALHADNFFIKGILFSLPRPEKIPKLNKHNFIQTVVWMSMLYLMKGMDFDFFCSKYGILFRWRNATISHGPGPEISCPTCKFWIQPELDRTVFPTSALAQTKAIDVPQKPAVMWLWGVHINLNTVALSHF